MTRRHSLREHLQLVRQTLSGATAPSPSEGAGFSPKTLEYTRQLEAYPVSIFNMEALHMPRLLCSETKASIAASSVGLDSRPEPSPTRLLDLSVRSASSASFARASDSRWRRHQAGSSRITLRRQSSAQQESATDASGPIGGSSTRAFSRAAPSGANPAALKPSSPLVAETPGSAPTPVSPTSATAGGVCTERRVSEVQHVLRGVDMVRWWGPPRLLKTVQLRGEREHLARPSSARILVAAVGMEGVELHQALPPLLRLHEPSAAERLREETRQSCAHSTRFFRRDAPARLGSTRPRQGGEADVPARTDPLGRHLATAPATRLERRRARTAETRRPAGCRPASA
eukprot:1194176-Prorocentrum_minimum.AAC.8